MAAVYLYRQHPAAVFRSILHLPNMAMSGETLDGRCPQCGTRDVARHTPIVPWCCQACTHTAVFPRTFCLCRMGETTPTKFCRGWFGWQVPWTVRLCLLLFLFLQNRHARGLNATAGLARASAVLATSPQPLQPVRPRQSHCLPASASAPSSIHSHRSGGHFSFEYEKRGLKRTQLGSLVTGPKQPLCCALLHHRAAHTHASHTAAASQTPAY